MKRRELLKFFTAGIAAGVVLPLTKAQAISNILPTVQRQIGNVLSMSVYEYTPQIDTTSMFDTVNTFKLGPMSLKVEIEVEDLETPDYDEELLVEFYEDRLHSGGRFASAVPIADVYWVRGNEHIRGTVPGIATVRDKNGKEYKGSLRFIQKETRKRRGNRTKGRDRRF